jgi:hypothetical protein
MKLTKRGKRVRAVAIILGIVFIYWIISNLWWVGDGYCWGSIIECHFPEEGAK